MSDVQIRRFGVDSTSRQALYLNTAGSFRLKNLGPEVVYLGRVQLAATPAPLDPAEGFPVAVGEVVEVPDATDADTFVPCINTAFGTSTVAVMGHQS